MLVCIGEPSLVARAEGAGSDSRGGRSRAGRESTGAKEDGRKAPRWRLDGYVTQGVGLHGECMSSGPAKYCGGLLAGLGVASSYRVLPVVDVGAALRYDNALGGWQSVAAPLVLALAIPLDSHGQELQAGLGIGYGYIGLSNRETGRTDQCWGMRRELMLTYLSPRLSEHVRAFVQPVLFMQSNSDGRDSKSNMAAFSVNLRFGLSLP